MIFAGSSKYIANLRYRIFAISLIAFLLIIAGAKANSAAAAGTPNLQEIKMQQSWQTPVDLPFPVNQAGWEDSVVVDPSNGNKIYFSYIPLDIVNYVKDLSWEYDKNNPNLTYPDPQKYKEKYIIGPERNVGFGALNSNIYEATLNGSSWEVRALPAPINDNLNNAPAEEHSPSMSSDGLTLYLTKQRIGLNEDIYMSQKNLSDNSWSDPIKVPVINFDDPKIDDGNAHISDDGNVIFFDSNRPGGKGQRDLYYSIKSAAGWSAPVALTVLNTGASDWQPFLTKDGRTIYFSSDRVAERNGIYRSDRLDKGWDNWSEPQLVAGANESTIIAGLGEPSVSADGRNLYFLYAYKRDDGRFESNIAVSTTGIVSTNSTAAPPMTFLASTQGTAGVSVVLSKPSPKSAKRPIVNRKRIQRIKRRLR